MSETVLDTNSILDIILTSIFKLIIGIVCVITYLGGMSLIICSPFLLLFGFYIWIFR